MTKVLKVPAKINYDQYREKDRRQYVCFDRTTKLAFSGDMKDWRSRVKGKDLF